MDKKIWIIIAVVVVAFGGLVWWSSSRANPNVVSSAQVDLFDPAKLITPETLPEGFTNDGQTPATDANNVYDRYYGNKDAKVVFIEYGDLSCSHCAQYDPIIEKARENYSEKVVFVFRYFYLGNQGANGLAAATAVEAAAHQDKFWEMKKLVYEKQLDWFYASANDRKGILQAYAELLSLNIDQWSKDYDEYQTNGIKTRIDFGHALGERIAIAGTPTIVINGYKLDPDKNEADKWSTQESLNGLIEKAIKEAYGEEAEVNPSTN
jgi:protein-disulfide isomerase